MVKTVLQQLMCFFRVLKVPARCTLHERQLNVIGVVQMDRVKRIWYLSPMRAAKVQASLRIRAVSPEPSLLAHTGSESRGTFRQKARSLAPFNGWACAVKICHDGMLEDTNSLDGAQMTKIYIPVCLLQIKRYCFKDHNAENHIQKFQLIPEI